MQSGFETFRDWLAFVADSPQRESRWLDLLSQLEYVGARKILKSVSFERIDGEILRHVAEEALHAHLLKAQAERLGSPGATWTANPLSAAGWAYFQSLDREISALQPDPRHHYPLVSWAIERRVMEVYPTYAAATRDPEVRQALTTILVQEKRHGKGFDEMDLPPAARDRAAAIESRLWGELLPRLQESLTVG